MKLVSCIMPSKRSASTVRRAIAGFREQTYPAKELVIVRVWDGHDPSWQPELQRNEKLVYLEHRVSIGELRNIAIRHSSGSVIAHCDDDDTSHPERLAHSMAAIDAGASLVGSSRAIFERIDEHQMSFHEPKHESPYRKRRWLFDGAALTPKYLVGGTLVYRRELWERHPFEDVQMGEDTRAYLAWLKALNHGTYLYPEDDPVVDLADERLYTATMSPDATSPKDPESPGWKEIR